MKVLETMLRGFSVFNEKTLNGFKNIAWVLTVVMTAIILIQVFFRYVLNSALAWPEEIARFMMVWMTFLVAPYAYRRGLNVNMELVVDMIKKRLRVLLEILLHLFVMGLAVVLFQEGLGMMKRGLTMRASTFDFKMIWIYLILPISFVMMFSVGVEKVLGSIKILPDPDSTIPYDTVPVDDSTPDSQS